MEGEPLDNILADGLGEHGNVIDDDGNIHPFGKGFKYFSIPSCECL
jgi:hypothetical protein